MELNCEGCKANILYYAKTENGHGVDYSETTKGEVGAGDILWPTEVGYFAWDYNGKSYRMITWVDPLAGNTDNSTDGDCPDPSGDEDECPQDSSCYFSNTTTYRVTTRLQVYEDGGWTTLETKSEDRTVSFHGTFSCDATSGNLGGSFTLPVGSDYQDICGGPVITVTLFVHAKCTKCEPDN